MKVNLTGNMNGKTLERHTMTNLITCSYVKDKAKSDQWNARTLAKSLSKPNRVIMSIKSCRNNITFKYKERTTDGTHN